MRQCSSRAGVPLAALLVTTVLLQLPTAAGADESSPEPRGVVNAENHYARGDSDCTVTLSATDIVTAVAGLGGVGTCGNGDCDRDGVENQRNDVACTVGCLFGPCRVPEHAPRILGVAPETADSVVPFSGIVITGENFGSEERPKRVVIGGVDAGLVDYAPPDTIRASVPPLPPGEVDVAVFDGDLEGARFPLSVVAPTLKGSAGRFADTHQLLADTLATFSGLELEQFYGEDAAVMRDVLQSARSAVDALLDELTTSGDVTPETIQTLDEAADSSGLTDRLLELIVELDEIATGNGGGAGPLVIIAGPAQKLGSYSRYAAAMSQTGFGVAVPGTTAATATGVAATIFFEATALIVAAEVLRTLAIDARVPAIPTELTFFDVNGAPSPAAIAGGSVRITARLIDVIPAQVFLRIHWNGKPIDHEPDRTGVDPTFLEFRLPQRIGLCDRIRIQLIARLGGLESKPVSLDLYPQLLDVLGPEVSLGETVELEVTGALGCNSVVVWAFERFGDPFFATGSELRPIGFDPPASLVRTTVPNLPQGPGNVFVELRDRALQSNSLPITFRSDVTGVTVACQSPVELGESAECTASPLPTGTTFPADATFSYLSTNGDVLVIEVGSGPATQNLPAVGVGSADIEVTLRSAVGILAFSQESARVDVVDTTAPVITLRPDPGQPAVVEPGDTLRLTAEAEDLGGVASIQFAGTAGVVESITPLATCDGGETCTVAVEIVLRDDTVATAVDVQAEATDAEGNSATSAPIVFTIRQPVGSIGGTVRELGTNNLIAGALVELLDVDGSVIADTTATNGSFVFEDLAVGGYEVRASAEGFTTRTEGIPVAAGDTHDITLELEPSAGEFLFVFAEVHELVIESCFIPRDQPVTVTEQFERRRNPYDLNDPLTPISLENLLRSPRRKLALVGAGWMRETGRDCPIFRSVLGVTVTQVGGLTLQEANQRVLDSPRTEAMPVMVPGCEILDSCE